MKTDVVIVGGGPAGLAAAIAARVKGFDVVVTDGAEPPIDKPCGEGLLPETLAALRGLGVTLGAADGVAFRGIRFVQEDCDVAADFAAPGMGVRRPLLHERMVERAEACGVRLLWKMPVSGIHADGVATSQGTIRARWIIGADGHGSRVRRWSGLEKATRNRSRYATRRRFQLAPWSHHMEIHWGRNAQAYVTPIGREEVCVAIVAEKREHAGCDTALEEMPELRERLRGATMSGRERGAVTAMRTLAHVQRGNVALVGDASSGVDAITGEGLRLGFAQAFALADALQTGDLRLYETAHRKIAAWPRWIGNSMLSLGRNPGLRRRVIQALSAKPELFGRLLATHVGPMKPAELLSVGARLGWELLAV